MSAHSPTCPRLSAIHQLLSEGHTTVSEYLVKMKLSLASFQNYKPDSEVYSRGRRYASCWLGFDTALSHFADFALGEASYYSLSNEEQADYFLGIIDGVVDHLSIKQTSL